MTGIATPRKRRGRSPQHHPEREDVPYDQWFYHLNNRRIVNITAIKIEVNVDAARKKIDLDAFMRHAKNECPGGESRNVLFEHFRLDTSNADPSKIVLIGSLNDLTLHGAMKAVHAFALKRRRSF